ncbi:TVP38/TMEM64 family protein [Tissierella sp.]|uniref:TVP38/TMEM64 family protein n=1 Tax=Tissierella sp. TaxID=41274 RepID=UPI0028AF3DF4|nr:TVP38/TMEM64 family protein [Tissierella sp.]
MKDKNSLLKFILTTGLIIAIALLINKFNIFKGYGPKEIKEFIQGKGVMAPMIYVALLSSLPLLLFPDSVLVIAGGMIFGLFWGTVLTTVGSLIGAAISFYISRKLGQQVVKKLIKKDLVLFDKKNSGFFLILMLRLIPLFPFKIVSYSAGLSDVRFKDFALATTIGSLPGIIVYTNLGDKTTVFGSKDFYLSIGLLIGLFIISFIMKKIFQEKGEKINE